jgi:hypothetical protein
MKVAKVTLFALLAALVAVGMSTTAYSFHSGGVAECGGCHSMHSPAPVAPGVLNHLLVGTDQSSTCLTCHEHAGDTGPSSYHISTAPADMPGGVPPLQRTPGGDFGWLKKTYTFAVRGTTTVEDGATHGHNIVSIDKGYDQDPTNAEAPGGSFSAASLACNSCHDPHGKYRRLSDGTIATDGAPIIGSGSYNNSAVPAAGQAVGAYRLLAGALYSKAAFPGVPAAKTPSAYNRTEATTQTRTAYGVAATGGHATWGNWCGTCHGDMHSTGNYVHPVDQGLGSTVAGLYGTYVKSGDMGGTPANSFTSLVPFSENTGDYATLATHALNTDAQLGGPGSSDQVNCMSCHRAHATGFPEMLRWNMENEFMVKNGIYQTTERGRSTAEAAAGYYDRPVTQFASYQRVLCNKCHAQD